VVPGSRGGREHLGSRVRWARIALEALRDSYRPAADAFDYGQVREVQQVPWVKG